MIRFSCPNCAKDLQIEKKDLGSRILCVRCNQSFEVSRPSGELVHEEPILETAQRELSSDGVAPELAISATGCDVPSPINAAGNVPGKLAKERPLDFPSPTSAVVKAELLSLVSTEGPERAGRHIHTSLTLLDRLRIQPDEAAWRRLDALYRPLIRHWLMRDPTLHDEAEDLVQEVLSVLVRELPHFRRERPGSFRRWLRTITLNRLKAFWQLRRHRAQLLGNDSQASVLSQLEDPRSDLSRQWDQEHDHHVVRRLMEIVEPQFEATTLQAFRRTVFDGAKASEVAAELEISVNAVLLAKSRVLKRLRQEGEGLIG